MGTAENSVNYHMTVKWTAGQFGCFNYNLKKNNNNSVFCAFIGINIERIEK